jgi:hypothetical protein
MLTPNKVSIARSRLEVRETVIGTRIALSVGKNHSATNSIPGTSPASLVTRATSAADQPACQACPRSRLRISGCPLFSDELQVIRSKTASTCFIETGGECPRR